VALTLSSSTVRMVYSLSSGEEDEAVLILGKVKVLLNI
jgi:hypothetical protein